MSFSEERLPLDKDKRSQRLINSRNDNLKQSPLFRRFLVIGLLVGCVLGLLGGAAEGLREGLLLSREPNFIANICGEVMLFGSIAGCVCGSGIATISYLIATIVEKT